MIYVLVFNENARPRGLLSGGLGKWLGVGRFQFWAARLPHDFWSTSLVCFWRILLSKIEPEKCIIAIQTCFRAHLYFCCYLLYFASMLTLPKWSKTIHNDLKKTLCFVQSTGGAFSDDFGVQIRAKKVSKKCTASIWNIFIAAITFQSSFRASRSRFFAAFRRLDEAFWPLRLSFTRKIVDYTSPSILTTWMANKEQLFAGIISSSTLK